ncbi:MAG: hypothetical protein QW727_00710 [Candidatus Pacearchaeota archaeon]
MKIKNKKAQVMTLIAIFLIILIFITFEVFSISQQRYSTATRISTMENFLNSIELNLERQIFISGFRIIFIAEDEIIKSGNYINDINYFFNESFFNGTVNGEENDILLGARYRDLIDSINEKAGKINVIINMSNSSIYVYQSDPWNVKITFISNFIMEDKSNLARWNKIQNITATIPIEGFEDPIYFINTNGKISNKINKTIYDAFPSNNTSVLIEHTKNSYYISSNLSPSFLDRIEGKITPNQYGIESLVYLPKLENQGIQVKQKSIVDYIYFSSLNPQPHQIQGMPSWFKLDSGHLEIYNATAS